MEWKPMKSMLTCECGSDRFAILNESGPYRIAVDPETFRIQCDECGKYIMIEGYQHNTRKN